jgi:hypothetical protein
MKQRKEFEDDGRVIANMNIEGTPWYVPEGMNSGDTGQNRTKPTRSETFAMIKGALAAGLVIGFVFVLAFFIFILFCTEIWFR